MAMDRVGVRQLRAAVAAHVRRASAGERVIITVDGRPVAKRSSAKESRGGAKSALRRYKPTGTAVEEVVHVVTKPEHPSLLQRKVGFVASEHHYDQKLGLFNLIVKRIKNRKSTINDYSIQAY